MAEQPRTTAKSPEDRCDGLSVARPHQAERGAPQQRLHWGAESAMRRGQSSPAEVRSAASRQTAAIQHSRVCFAFVVQPMWAQFAASASG